MVSFNLVDEDSVLVKRERLCDNCVTQTNQTDMMKLLVQAPAAEPVAAGQPQPPMEKALPELTVRIWRAKKIQKTSRISTSGRVYPKRVSPQGFTRTCENPNFARRWADRSFPS